MSICAVWLLSVSSCPVELNLDTVELGMSLPELASQLAVPTTPPPPIPLAFNCSIG